jgi:hypothetical protein
MKRWISVFCLLLIPAFGLLAPAGAQASTIAATKLTSGKPVKVTISKPGQTIKYTFAATANENVTFQVTKFDFPGNTVQLQFFEPGSSSYYTYCNFTANSYCNFSPPSGTSGTWSVEVIGINGATGSLTLTFANNVPTQELTSGKAVTTTISIEGQEAGYTFAATKNHKVTFQVTKFDFPGNTVQLQFFEPGSSSYYTYCNFIANGTCPFTTPVGGTWSIALIPINGATGSLTIKLT